MPAPTMQTSALTSSVNLPSEGISSEDAIQTEVVSPESVSILLHLTPETSLLILARFHLLSPEEPLRAVLMFLSCRKCAAFLKNRARAALHVRVKVLRYVRELPAALIQIGLLE